MVKKTLALALACAAALCLSVALVGCGGGGGASSGGSVAEDPAKAFYGTWEFTGMEENGEATSQEDIDLLKSMGLNCTVTLGEDLSVTFDMFGDVATGTWEVKAADVATLILDGADSDVQFEDPRVDAKLVDETMVLESGGVRLTFVKAGTAPAPAPAPTPAPANDDDDDASAIAAAKATGTVVVDNDVCTIYALPAAVKGAGPGFPLVIVNNSDKDLGFLAEVANWTVNGEAPDDVVCAEFVDAGEVEDDGFLWILGPASPDALTNVVGEIEVMDDDTYETLGVYPVKL